MRPMAMHALAQIACRLQETASVAEETVGKIFPEGKPSRTAAIAQLVEGHRAVIMTMSQPGDDIGA